MMVKKSTDTVLELPQRRRLIYVVETKVFLLHAVLHVELVILVKILHYILSLPRMEGIFPDHVTG